MNGRLISRVRARLPGLRRETLAWALGEIVIVVAGVLIAFALNAWWLERESLWAEQRHLRSLSVDFEQNRGSLRELIARQERVEQASVELLALARSEAGSPSTDVRALLMQVFSSARFEPVMGAYDTLLNSGGLALIEDVDLRSSLAAFAARMDGRYSERFADELYFSLLRDFAGRIGFADEVLKDRRSGQSFTSLLSDARFQEYLALRHVAEGEVAGQYRGFLVLVEGILDDVQNQLH
jgi:hypothetical protein